MSDEPPVELDDRILVLPPTPRDGAATRDLLAAAGVRCHLCATVEDVCREAGRGTGAAVVTAEAVLGDAGGLLAGLLRAQPPWSDLPLVVLTPPGPESPKLLRALETVGPMTLMKRPVQVSTLVSAVRAALRDRRRQYAVRDLLVERERTAEALRAEREQYRVTLSSIGDAVIATDTEARVTFMNPVARGLTGWDPADARGRPLGEVFRILDEVTRRPVENPAVRALREGAVAGLANHTVLVARDGTERPLDDSAAPIRGAGGEVVGAVLVFRDVTEKREAERALRAEERRAAAVLESITDGFCALDRDWRFTYVNRRAEALLGRTRDHLVGRNHWEEYPGTVGTAVERNYRRAAAENVAVAFEFHFPPHDRWYEVHAYPSADGLAVYFRDVTERRRAEAELREKDERLKLLVGQATDYALVMTDPAGRVLEWAGGAEGITGWREDEVRGHPAAVIFTPEDRAAGRSEEEMRQAAETGRAADERWHVRKDGSRFFAAGVLVALRGPGGGLRGFGKVFQDVTDRKRAEEELRDAARRKDEFLAMLAHELRNPLAPVRNALQVMRLAGDDRAAFARAREMLERQVGHMVRLIDDLMDVSRVSRGKVELRTARVDLAAVVAAALETSGPVVDAAGHALAVTLPDRPVSLEADATRLAQVVGNLLNNAAKYTEPGGRIWLEAGREGDEAVVRVRDTGVGIPPEMLPRVFDLFTQVDYSADRAKGGLGIGLTLVKSLVELHGGAVEAASPGRGRGSEFTVRLPALTGDDPGGKGERGAGDDSVPAGGKRRRILVVDDNRDAATSLGMLLEMLGHEVRAVYDGPAALAAVEASRPDVVLLDLGMPGMTGYEVAARLRERPGGANLWLVALTGWGAEDDRRRAREAGFDHHLVKPVAPTELQAYLSYPEARI